LHCICNYAKFYQVLLSGTFGGALNLITDEHFDTKLNLKYIKEINSKLKNKHFGESTNLRKLVVPLKVKKI